MFGNEEYDRGWLGGFLIADGSVKWRGSIYNKYKYGCIEFTQKVPEPLFHTNNILLKYGIVSKWMNLYYYKPKDLYKLAFGKMSDVINICKWVGPLHLSRKEKVRMEILENNSRMLNEKIKKMTKKFHEKRKKQMREYYHRRKNRKAL